MYLLDDYNYELPEYLIAQKPAIKRDQSNLMCVDRKTGGLSHHRFHQIGRFMKPGDVLVVNDTAVIPGRLEGKKETGGKVEVLISDFVGGLRSNRENGHFVSECIVKASKRPKSGTRFYFEEGLSAEVLKSGNGTQTLRFYSESDFISLLYRIGKVPLPPYIKRDAEQATPCNDMTSYQTVYASSEGAIAAPTAGLHFTKALLNQLSASGIKIVPLTLHVGYGTFSPVRVDDIRSHKMHSERFSISEQTAEAINTARAGGKRVIAVGTTSMRTLEYTSDAKGFVKAGSGSCDLFIFPGYRFKVVDTLLTNFHLPKSTLLMLVSAFADRESIFRAYQEAIKRRYRFYSYGDAMFIH